MRSERLRSTLDALHVWVFGTGLSDRARGYWANVGYASMADLLITGLSFVLTIWIVRVLGPAEFGTLNVVVGLSQLFLVPMLFGLPSAITQHMASGKPVGEVLSTGAMLFAGYALVAVSVALVWTAGLGQLLRTSSVIVCWSLAYAVCLAVYQISYSGLAGLRDFRGIAQHTAVSGGCYVGATALVLWLVAPLTFGAIVLTNALRSVVFALRSMSSLAGHVARPTRSMAKSLATMSLYGGLATVSGFFFLGSIDNVMLNAYAGPETVGLYAAYYTAFNVVSSRILKPMFDVLLPTAAEETNPPRLLPRVLRASVTAGLPGIPVTFVLCVGFFVVIGPAFTFAWLPAVLMGVMVFLYATVGALGQLITATGMPLIRLGTAAAFVASGANVVGNVTLIPRYGIEGCMMATILASLVAISLQVGILSSAGSR